MLDKIYLVIFQKFQYVINESKNQLIEEYNNCYTTK